MNDLSAAIAAAREAYNTPLGEHPFEGMNRCMNALGDLLAAIDAAQGEAVLFVKAEQLADPRFVGINAVRDSHLDHMRGLYTVPLYLAPVGCTYHCKKGTMT